MITIEEKKGKKFGEVLEISGKIILGIVIIVIGAYIEGLIGIDLFY